MAPEQRPRAADIRELYVASEHFAEAQRDGAAARVQGPRGRKIARGEGTNARPRGGGERFAR